MRCFALASAAVLVLAGCARGSADTPPLGIDAGPGMDAGTSPGDGGSADTGPRPDGSPLGTDAGPSTSSDGGTGTDAGSGTDAGPIPVDAGSPIDSGPVGCTGSPCRLAPAQCGCGVGEGCYFDPASGANFCHASGTQPEGATCFSSDDCAARLDCVPVQGTATSVCVRYCSTNTDCTGGGQGTRCFRQRRDGTGALVPGTNYCTIGCDPIAQTGCPSGTKCDVVAAMGGRVVTDCTANGGSTGGCSTGANCAAGFTCVSGQCERICDVGAGTPCSFCFPIDGLISGAPLYGTCN